jgi:hypothetical protein
MTQYAYFNSAADAPQPVLGWYDTVAVKYHTLPPAANLLALTPAQWYARMPGPWAVMGRTLVPYTAPAPVLTLAQQALTAISAGLSISLSGSITLAATSFPTDPTTQVKLGAVVTAVMATGAFPGGGTTYPMKDLTGTWHTFTVGQYTAVAGAIATYVAALDMIADGNPMGATSLPVANVALSV